MLAPDIYQYVTGEETAFIKPISVADGWDWSMHEHRRLSFLYKNSQFADDNDDRRLRPYKNIIRSVLNIQYRTEGFDVKDIELYVNDAKKYYKSFLIKKFHENWALENELDTFIDDVVESYVDYGLTVVKNVSKVRPEVVDIQTISFCDQTDFLGGPFAIKHYYGPAKLLEMEKVGWGKEENGATIDLQALIDIAEYHKKQDLEQGETKTPGKYVEIYEVHGMFPDEWCTGKGDNYTQQMHIIAFYKDSNDNKTGVTLFKTQEKLRFKILKRDKIFGRACGFGGAEELFEAQVWTNYTEIQKTEMLDAASKILYQTTDHSFKTRNNLANKKNQSVLVTDESATVGRIDNTPANISYFNESIAEWDRHARVIGSAGESLDGTSPASGTPFKLQELVTMEAKGLHHYRQGKIAVFMDEIYRDWILPYIQKEIVKDTKFLAELSADEFQYVVSSIVDNRADQWAINKFFDGEIITQDMIDFKKDELRSQFTKNGNKIFIEWLKDEFKDAPIAVKTNIAGKQKDLALLTDKMVNVLRQFISTPQIREDPQMVKLLNTILESSGMSPVLFAGVGVPAQQQQQGQGGTEPLKELGEAVKEKAIA